MLRDVNHPSRVGVLPNMPNSNVAAVSEQIEEQANLLCLDFIYPLINFGFGVHEFPPPL